MPLSPKTGNDGKRCTFHSNMCLAKRGSCLSYRWHGQVSLRGMSCNEENNRRDSGSFRLTTKCERFERHISLYYWIVWQFITFFFLVFFPWSTKTTRVPQVLKTASRAEKPVFSFECGIHTAYIHVKYLWRHHCLSSIFYFSLQGMLNKTLLGKQFLAQ